YRTTYNIQYSWIDGRGSKYKFGNTPGYFNVGPINVYQYSGCTPSCDPYPSDAALFDNQAIESRTSEFMRLSSGNYATGQGNPPAPASIQFKNGNQLVLSAPGSAGLVSPNGNYLLGD